MTELFAAISVFLLAHLVPAVPSVRRRFVAFLGERTYLTVYSIVSIVLLVWVIVALLRTPYIHLWTPPLVAYRVAVVLMAPAFVLVTAGLLEPNPLSISLSAEDFDPERPGIVAVTRHPVLWGFGLWAAMHGAVNGALAPLILFGGMTLLALAGMVLVDRKRRKLLGRDKWYRLARTMSLIPFGALFWHRTGRVLTRRTVIGASVGLGLYFLFLFWIHNAWFGRDPLGVVLP